MCFGAHVPGGVRNETRGVASFLLLAAGSATTLALALLAVCVQRRVTNAVAEHELGGSMTALYELSWWWWR